MIQFNKNNLFSNDSVVLQEEACIRWSSSTETSVCLTAWKRFRFTQSTMTAQLRVDTQQEDPSFFQQKHYTKSKDSHTQTHHALLMGVKHSVFDCSWARRQRHVKQRQHQTPESLLCTPAPPCCCSRSTAVPNSTGDLWPLNVRAAACKDEGSQEKSCTWGRSTGDKRRCINSFVKRRLEICNQCPPPPSRGVRLYPFGGASHQLCGVSEVLQLHHPPHCQHHLSHSRAPDCDHRNLGDWSKKAGQSVRFQLRKWNVSSTQLLVRWCWETGGDLEVRGLQKKVYLSPFLILSCTNSSGIFLRVDQRIEKKHRK